MKTKLLHQITRETFVTRVVEVVNASGGPSWAKEGQHVMVFQAPDDPVPTGKMLTNELPIQSVVMPGRPNHVPLTYAASACTTAHLGYIRSPQALVVGTGLGSVSRYFHRVAGFGVTAIDLFPEVNTLALLYDSKPDDRSFNGGFVDYRVADGMEYLETTSNVYNVVVLDGALPREFAPLRWKATALAEALDYAAKDTLVINLLGESTTPGDTVRDTYADLFAKLSRYFKHAFFMGFATEDPVLVMTRWEPDFEEWKSRVSAADFKCLDEDDKLAWLVNSAWYLRPDSCKVRVRTAKQDFLAALRDFHNRTDEFKG